MAFGAQFIPVLDKIREVVDMIAHRRGIGDKLANGTKKVSVDFGEEAQIADFLLRYLPADARKDWLHTNQGTPNFGYLAYDWGLNKLK